MSSLDLGDSILNTVQVCSSQFIWPFAIILTFYFKLGNILNREVTYHLDLADVSALSPLL